MTDNNKPTVVDDFFLALFANNDNNLNTKETVTEEKSAHQQQQQPQPTKNNFANKKREKELDEFDEYSLLCKRKYDDDDQSGRYQVATKKRALPESKGVADWNNISPESRMLIRQIPDRIDKQDLMDHFSTYGDVLEVVFKNSFGFVQFDSPSTCANAVKCENGKIFKGFVLELEVCRTKPHFLRKEERYRKKVERGYPIMNDNSKSNGKNHRRFEDHKWSKFRQQPQAKYVDNSHLSQLEVPMVKIIAWNNVSKQFILFVENQFRKKNISIATVNLQYPNTRESLLKQMIREGVKAVATINRDLESQRKISIQVFTPNEIGTGVRYDEYDSIVSEQAAEIVLRSISHSVFKSTYPNSTSTLNSNHASAMQSSSIINTPTTVIAQSLPSSVEPNTFPANYNVSQAKPNPVRQYHRSNAAPTSMQYQALLQTQYKQQPPQQPPQQPQQQPQQQQPTVSQLLATFISGINPKNTSSAASSLPQLNLSVPIPLKNQSSPQANIAQLLSTVMNGNPLLGQLVGNQAPVTSHSTMINDNQLRNILANYQLLTSQPSPSQATPTTSTSAVVHNNPALYNLTTMAKQ